MALFWHHHFATAYQKISDTYGGTVATRMLAASEAFDGPTTSPVGRSSGSGPRGSATSTTCSSRSRGTRRCWLARQPTQVRGSPKENFAREVMELFTVGIRPSDSAPNNYTEDDVKAAARVFTGWNLSVGARGANNVNDSTLTYNYLYRADRHDTASKTFSFDIYPGGGRTITSSGEQEGDGLPACLLPASANRAAAGAQALRLLRQRTPTRRAESFVDRVANTFYSTNFDMRRVVLQVLLAPSFQDKSNYFTRYAWPVEFVVKSIKETGLGGVLGRRSPLAAAPRWGRRCSIRPTWIGFRETGAGWFSTGGMLARMNFAATLTQNQRFNLRDAARSSKGSPESVLSYTLDRLSPMPFDSPPYNELLGYLRAGTNWTGSDAELLAKAAGVTHLVLASPEYQFV